MHDGNDDTDGGLEGLLALVGDLEPGLVGLVGPPLLDVEVELEERDRNDVSEMIRVPICSVFVLVV